MPNGKDEAIPLKPISDKNHQNPEEDQNDQDLDEDSSFLDILKHNKPKENGQINGQINGHCIEAQEKLNQNGVQEKVTFV